MLDAISESLDWAGMLPGVGIVPDLLNAGLNAARGRMGASLMSLAAAAPGIGLFAGAGKLAAKSGSKVTSAMGKFDGAVSAAKTKFDDVLGKFKTKTDCLPGSSNCFIAGTQVVVGIALPATATPVSLAALDITAAGSAPPQNLPAIAPTEDLDAYYAAGALAMAAALSYRRREETRRFRRPRV